MSLEIKGKIVKKLEPRFYDGRNGQVQIDSFIVETNEQYPKKIMMECFGTEKVDVESLPMNQEKTFSFNLESREYNGKYYTNLKCWKVS
jgi:hypothetical protein